jgi:hypothetical protein
MAKNVPITKIIEQIRALHEEDPSDGLSTPFIRYVEPRGPSYYNEFLNQQSETNWSVRKLDSAGPPLLAPIGEEWDDEETGEMRSGLRKWPRIDSQLNGPFQLDSVDALAWYRSFHYEPIPQWGIYLLDKGIYYLAKKLEDQFDPSEITSETRQKCINDAVAVLYYHELFHFYTDLAAAKLEIEDCRSMYVDYFYNRYPEGWTRSNGAPTEIPSKLEEALANEFARSKTLRNTSTSFRKTLVKFMKSQPDGYKHWGGVKHNQRWKSGLSKLGERLLNNDDPLPNYMHITALEDAIQREYEWQVPVYIVDTIPDDIHRFASIKRFDKITISEKARKLLKKIRNPILTKKVNARITKLSGTQAKHDKNLHQLGRDGWWKYDLGKSGDAHGNPRMILRETNAASWILEWVGKHSDYDKWRAKEGI